MTNKLPQASHRNGLQALFIKPFDGVTNSEFLWQEQAKNRPEYGHEI